MENLIIKYLNNTINKAELVKLRKWLEDPENQVKFKSFTKLHYNLDMNYQSSAAEAYEIIKKQLKKERKINFRPYLKYAAIFIVALGVLGYAYFNSSSQPVTKTHEDLVKLELHDGTIKYIEPNQTNFKNEENNLTGNQEVLRYGDTTVKSEEVFYNTLSVPYGKTFSLILSDGTQINLNAGSSLRYPTIFNKDSIKRKVYLNGEGYFKVTHQEKHPFIVSTDNLNIQVLGTQFNVNAYREDDKAYVVLVKGKIRAENPKNNTSIDVKPGYKVFYKHNTLKTEKVSIAKYIDWINGELILIHDPFKVIKHKLERKYDVEIINNYKALNNLIITASFSDETIDQVLNTFKAYKNFRYIHQGKQIIINNPKN